MPTPAWRARWATACSGRRSPSRWVSLPSPGAGCCGQRAQAAGLCSRSSARRSWSARPRRPTRSRSCERRSRVRTGPGSPRSSSPGRSRTPCSRSGSPGASFASRAHARAWLASPLTWERRRGPECCATRSRRRSATRASRFCIRGAAGASSSTPTAARPNLRLPTARWPESRAATARVALVLHDPALVSEPELARALGSAARLSVENEALRAEAMAQLHALQTSRARIVETADSARRRLERDLHDGAQQRLLALSYDLRLARTGAADDDDGELVSTAGRGRGSDRSRARGAARARARHLSGDPHRGRTGAGAPDARRRGAPPRRARRPAARARGARSREDGLCRRGRGHRRCRGAGRGMAPRPRPPGGRPRRRGRSRTTARLAARGSCTCWIGSARSAAHSTSAIPPCEPRSHASSRRRRRHADSRGDRAPPRRGRDRRRGSGGGR